MKNAKLVRIAGLLAATMVLSMQTAAAQTVPPQPSMKTIGTPTTAAKPEIVPSLFVLNSRGATLQGDTLTLIGVTPSAIIFADRPVRAAGHQPTADVISEWGSGDDSFAKNPPNATVSVLGKDGSVKDAVVVLKNPKLGGDKLTFSVHSKAISPERTAEPPSSSTSSAGRSRRFPLLASRVALRSAGQCMPAHSERRLTLRPTHTDTVAQPVVTIRIRLATDKAETLGGYP